MSSVIFLLSLVVAGSLAHEQFELLVTSRQTSDYYIKHNAFPDLRMASVCAWVRSTETTGIMAIVSYASSKTLNNELFFVVEQSSIGFYVGSQNRKASIDSSFRDGTWRHLCGTWSAEGGHWAIYLDGMVLGQGSELNNEGTINAGGALVIAQDQDDVGGVFDEQQCFVGALTDVNIYDRVLSANEVALLAISCTYNTGTIFKWSDVRGGLRGNVHVLPSSLLPSDCERKKHVAEETP